MLLIARNWRQPRLVVVFFIVEFLFTIPALVLYALADPNEYRTKLWVDGAANGFNSSPSTALYEAANYRPVHIPLVWQPLYVRCIAIGFKSQPRAVYLESTSRTNS